MPFLCLIALGVISAAPLLNACGGGGAAPGALDEAFLSAHPSVTRPEALATVAASIESVRQGLAARLEEGTPVFLPPELPPGWGLAAPYVAVGSGAALPNPEIWARGYRVTYTDGVALFVIAVGLEHVPGEGVWEPAGLRIGGRQLFRRADGRRTVLASRPAADWRLTIVGDGLARAETEALARALVRAPVAP